MNAQALREAAERYASRGEWALALRCFSELQTQRPGDADVLLQLSYVHSMAGHYREAKSFAVAAARAAPVQTEQVLELIARLRTFNEVPLLHATLERLQPFERMPVAQLIGFAAQWSYLGDQPMALRLLDVAQWREAENPAVHLARGQVLTYLGRFDEAEMDLQACLRLAPGLTRAWPTLVGLRKQTAAANCVPALAALLALPGLRADAVADVAYALHKTLDDLHDYEGAWTALALGMHAKRSILRYQSAETVALIDALTSLPMAGSARAAQHANGMQVTPIFIVGMHRSGTTLLEQLLQGHSNVRGLGELYDFTCQMREATGHHCRGVIDLELVQRAAQVDWDAVGRGYLQGVAWRLGNERCFIDKQPANFLNLGFICRALPQARVLHMRRDPMETCFSNLRELFLDANAYSYEQRELAAYFRQYQRLMKHWQTLYSENILDVEYAQLVAAPEPTMRKVAQFCGLEFEPGMLELRPNAQGVATASAVAVRQPVAVRDRPKWAAYGERLQPLAKALAE